MGVTPFPWFWRECRHIHFSRASRGGARRANPPRSSRPSSLLRKERARCSESNAAIDESKRALTSSPMRPVRPGGTSTTDSPCPSAHSPRIIEWDRALATPASTHCGWIATARMTPSSAARRPSSSPKNALTTADPFDRRALPSPIHEDRPAAPRRRKPPIHLLRLLDREGDSRHRSWRYCLPAKGDRTAREGINPEGAPSFLSSNTHASSKTAAFVLARPATAALAGSATNTLECERLGTCR